MTEIEIPQTSAPASLSDELRARLRSMPEGETGLFLAIDEIAAIADVLDYQHGRIEGHRFAAAEAREALDVNDKIVAADEVLISRMIAVIKLARNFAMRPIVLPGSEAVRDYLARYIDRGDWGAMTWPDGIPVAARYLSALGYLSVGGQVARSAAQNPERTETHEERSNG